MASPQSWQVIAASDSRGMFRSGALKWIDAIQGAARMGAIGATPWTGPNCRIHGQTFDTTIKWHNSKSHAKGDSPFGVF
jgi:hypothetical protein